MAISTLYKEVFLENSHKHRIFVSTILAWHGLHERIAFTLRKYQKSTSNLSQKKHNDGLPFCISRNKATRGVQDAKQNARMFLAILCLVLF